MVSDGLIVGGLGLVMKRYCGWGAAKIVVDLGLGGEL